MKRIFVAKLPSVDSWFDERVVDPFRKEFFESDAERHAENHPEVVIWVSEAYYYGEMADEGAAVILVERC
jgi:hypothetical protein